MHKGCSCRYASSLRYVVFQPARPLTLAPRDCSPSVPLPRLVHPPPNPGTRLPCRPYRRRLRVSPPGISFPESDEARTVHAPPREAMYHLVRRTRSPPDLCLIMLPGIGGYRRGSGRGIRRVNSRCRRLTDATAELECPRVIRRVSPGHPHTQKEAVCNSGITDMNPPADFRSDELGPKYEAISNGVGLRRWRVVSENYKPHRLTQPGSVCRSGLLYNTNPPAPPRMNFTVSMHPKN